MGMRDWARTSLQVNSNDANTFHEELAEYILTHLDTFPISRFINERLILLQPMVNPFGYFHDEREEIYLDINRDFNYYQHEDQCFNSQGAKALAHVFSNYLILAGASFHGGDNVLSYPWGGDNHRVSMHSKFRRPSS